MNNNTIDGLRTRFEEALKRLGQSGVAPEYKTSENLEGGQSLFVIIEGRPHDLGGFNKFGAPVTRYAESRHLAAADALVGAKPEPREPA